MDFKKTKWIETKRENWPSGSLERHLLLNYPGCKTLKEAVEKAIRDKLELEELKKQLAGANEGTKKERD